MRAYSNIEQSKKLADILPLESADMHYVLIDTESELYSAGLGEYIGILPHYPCWSLVALMDVLDRGALFKTPKGWACQAYIGSKAITSNYHNNPVDACVAMILKLHEQKLL